MEQRRISATLPRPHHQPFSASIATVLALLTSHATSQTFRWLEATPATNPGARSGHSLIYAGSSDHVLLFGGQAGQTVADTWLWNGTTWSQLQPASSPPARHNAAIAYDAARDRVVLFGGSSAAQAPLGDTWEWDGTSWSQRTTTSNPTARSGHAMTYDATSQRVICFGGLDSSQADLSDTWSWDGTTWSQLSPIASPAARTEHAMAYDSDRQRIVLFGGINATFGTLADTWEWTGSTWLPRLSANFPSGRQSHAMVYDDARDVTLLFGGSDGQALADTWQWDGSNWQVLTPSSAIPPPRSEHAMAYHHSRRQVTLFGGTDSSAFDDTWLSNPTAVTYGNGCGNPPLGFEPDPAFPASVGQFAQATIVQSPTSFAGVTLGLDDQFFGPFPLPFPLIGVGMPGCDLLHSADVLGLVAMPQTASTLRFSLAIPAQAGLTGAHIYAQAYAFAPGANPLQIIASNGIDWTISCGFGAPGQIVEMFDNTSQLDAEASAGTWAGGFGTFASIGGDGRHGAFDLGLASNTGLIVAGKQVFELDCDNTTIPATQTTTGTPIVVTDGRFYFTSMHLPADKRLRFIGSNPPVITVAGRLDIDGDIEVLGQSVTQTQISTLPIGQAGGAGGIFGGDGGQGGDRCNGAVGTVPDNHGRNGQNASVLAGHSYLGSTAGTGGQGSQIYPASGLNVSQQFAIPNPSPTAFYYCLSAGPGGSGGGLRVPGGQGFVEGVFSGPTPVPNMQSFMGPPTVGGTAMQLFPFPAPTGLQKSSQHFMIGGAGGGGAASACTLSLALNRTWSSGSGGGGGGGALGLRAGGVLRLGPGGRLLASGGSAKDYIGTSAGAQVGPAGGGSGGSIIMQSGGLTQILGSIQVEGGAGAIFERQGGSGFGPIGGIVKIRGGDGSPGFVRLEAPTAPPLSQLATVVPAMGPESVAALTEIDDLVSMRSKFYVTYVACGLVMLSYELHAIVDGVPTVFSDDPSISPIQATTGSAVRVMFQAAQIDPVNGAVLSTGPWRQAVATSPGQTGISADGRNGYRFVIVFDRTLATSVSIDSLAVNYLN